MQNHTKLCHKPHSLRKNAITLDTLDHAVDTEEEHRLVLGITGMCCQLLDLCYRSTWRTQGLVDLGAPSNPPALLPAAPARPCCHRAGQAAAPALASAHQRAYSAQGSCHTCTLTASPGSLKSFPEALVKALTSLQ